MNTGTTATFEGWMRAGATATGSLTIVERYADGAEHKGLGMSRDGRISYQYAGSPWYQGVTPGPSGVFSFDNQWHHLAFVRRAAGTWSTYYDGNAVVHAGPGTGLFSGCWVTCGIINANTDTSIGTLGYGTGYELRGMRVSNVERYTSNFTPSATFVPDAGTVMLLDFAEGAGNQIHDRSSNQQVGVLEGTVTWIPGADAASIQTLGTGCAGSLGVPVLSGVNASVPRLGQAVSLRVDHVPSARGAALMANLTGVSMGVALPVDLASYGLPGCQLYAFGLSGPFTAEVGNVVNWSMSIPNVAALSGFAFDVQALIFDVASSQAGLALSNGLRLTLGS
jgi:hypothetical protein